MKKIYLLCAVLILSIENVKADEITVIAGDNSVANAQDYYIGILETETGQITRVKDLDWSNGFAPSISTADPLTGKVYTFENTSAGTGFQIYDANTNTNSSPSSVLGAQIFAVLPTVKPKGVDGVISLTNEDAEIRIDEANNTVNIDNAALSDGAGKNIISLETDGSVALGDNDMVVIDDEGITIDGKQLIAEKDDGAIHIGENSLITIEQGGVQKLYAEDANEDPINIDITNGSDLLINGVSVSQRLNANNQSYINGIANSLSDGIEDSSAMGAALSALPNSAPEALAYCGGGFGAYGNSQALAMGCASNLNEKVSLNFGASVLSTGGATVNNRDFDDYSFKAGVTYKFGVDASKSKSAKTAALEAVVFKQQSDLQSMTAREAYKDTKIAEYEDRITKLEEAKLADAAKYNNRLAKLEKRLERITVAIIEDDNKLAGLVK